MELEMIPFRAHHVALIKPDAGPEILDLAGTAEQYGNAFTLCLLGDPVACGGVAVRSPVFAEMWGLFSPLVKQSFAKSLFKNVKVRLDKIIAESKIERVVSVIDKDDATGRRFIEHLGFVEARVWYERTTLCPR